MVFVRFSHSSRAIWLSDLGTANTRYARGKDCGQRAVDRGINKLTGRVERWGATPGMLGRTPATSWRSSR